jgi:membrane-bound lytic murein transglycosylase MltF
MKKSILVFILVILPSLSFGFERFNAVMKYDPHFSKYTKRYFGPGFDWRYFKAQAIAESHLKSDAVSYVGAKGVMQIMPRTFKEIKTRNPEIKGAANNPRWNIAAGIYYDRQIWLIFKAKRPFQDKLSFMFGAYNAGKGNIIRAQRISKREGKNPNLWRSIEVTLPRVTGRSSNQTIEYVKKIKDIREALK